MAKNEELISQIGELAAQLEIDPPETADLKNAELAAMVGNLRASLVAAEPEGGPNPEGAPADAVAAREAASALRAAAAETSFEYTVAPGKAITRTRTASMDAGVSTTLKPGGIIGPGGEVTADDLKNGKKDLAKLVNSGVVLKG